MEVIRTNIDGLLIIEPPVLSPKGFAVLTEIVVFQYKCDEFYHPEADRGFGIIDDSFGIVWKIPTEHVFLPG